jgi:hypothetical protein
MFAKGVFGFFAGAMVVAVGFVPVGGHVVQAIRDYDGSDPSLLPKSLSATGLYADAASRIKATTAGIKAYEVNTALWSDGAAKQRFVDVPSGSKIIPTDSDQYAIPDKTVFIKNFSIDTVYGDSASRILIETRFLVVRKDPAQAEKQYHGFTYKWRRDQKDAELVDPGAGLDTTHLVRLHGKAAGKRWSYPSGSDCNQCHRGRGTLGFITPQLNRPDAANPAVNQLKALYTAGILSVDIYKSTLHRWVGAKETGTGADAEAKVRSYLAANCSHCHGNKVSLEGAEHDFDYFAAGREIRFPQSARGFVGKPAGREPGYPQIVYPGYPESSYVVFRMQSRGDLSYRGTAQMPPLATYQMDSGMVGIMRDWICSLAAKPRACVLPGIQDDASYWEPVTGLFPHRLASTPTAPAEPTLRRGILSVPATALSGRVPGGVRLLSITGAEIPLAPLGAGRWRAACSGNGLYIVIQGGRSIVITVTP